MLCHLGRVSTTRGCIRKGKSVAFATFSAIAEMMRYRNGGRIKLDRQGEDSGAGGSYPNSAEVGLIRRVGPFEGDSTVLEGVHSTAKRFAKFNAVVR